VTVLELQLKLWFGLFIAWDGLVDRVVIRRHVEYMAVTVLEL